MEKAKPVVGYAMCGSFCTLNTSVNTLVTLCGEYNVMPIMSEIAYTTDTRFGTALNFIERVETATGHSVIHTVKDAEPIGPKRLFDCMVIAPCTGNTLAKIANGITDSAVTMAAKAHLRNNRPLCIAVATNDALSGSAKNIGLLLNMKNVYFVPFSQDDPHGKPRSCIADFSLIKNTVASALRGIQIQPIIK